MIGSHLFQTLRGRGEEVIGCYYRPTVALEEIAADGELVELDVRYFEPFRRLLQERRPGKIFDPGGTKPADFVLAAAMGNNRSQCDRDC